MPSSRSFGYIDLERSFRLLVIDSKMDDSQTVDLSAALPKSVSWNELLEKWRVVILSEAGSGKTKEIREAAIRLTQEGKSAFFLKLESIVDKFEDAFEVGSTEEFHQWRQSDEEAWLFLDSVDESRLKSAREFENAIRRLGQVLDRNLSRIHLIFTSRPSAWRPSSDRRTCDETFEFAAKTQQGNLSEQGGTVRDEDKTSTIDPVKFQFFTLEDLNSDQVRRFAEEKGVRDIDLLIEEIEASGADALAARPQDLINLIELWNTNHRLGSRHEVQRNFVELRLRELDQNRAGFQTVDRDRVFRGAKLLAAATTMIRNQEIRVPDGDENNHGIPIDPLLPDWTTPDRAELLQRPVFDDGLYGTVRFHHRTTREYLTAEWFSDLLGKGISRRSVEGMFFTKKYNERVVPPSLRPVLPWLALQDEGIRRKILDWAPEIFLEGGDPSRLPKEVRQAALRLLCERLATNWRPGQIGDPALYASFAKEDLTPDIRDLLKRYGHHQGVASFLFELVQYGRLVGLWSEVKRIATSALPNELRRSAVDAANIIGSSDQLRELRNGYLTSSKELDRNLVAAFVSGHPMEEDARIWLLPCLERCPAPKRFSYDPLSSALSDYTDKAEVERLPALLEGIDRLLRSEPRIQDVRLLTSERYVWLMEMGCQALIRLIENGSRASLEPYSLAILRRVEELQHRQEHDVSQFHDRLQRLVLGWVELKRGLFWFSVKVARENLVPNGVEKRLIRWWQVYPREMLKFQLDEMPLCLGDIASKEDQDDRMVALSVMQSLYVEANRPADWLSRIQEAIRGNSELEASFEQFLSEPLESSFERDQRIFSEKHQREVETRKAEQAKKLEKARKYFRANLKKLKNEVKADPDRLHPTVIQLLQVCQSKAPKMTAWSLHDWRNLEPDYGPEVARFFRDAVVSFWRHHSAQLRSEGATLNKVTYGVLAGLAGLAIESRERLDWLEGMTPTEVERACRFASFEMNDFPHWFSTLFVRYPEQVGAFLLREIRFELLNESAEMTMTHIVHRLKWNAEWCWEWLAPRLKKILERKEPKNLETLDALLGILRKSSISNTSIAKLSVRKCKDQNLPSGNLSSWFAAWVGSDPAKAIPALEMAVENLPDARSKTEFVMNFATRILAGRRADKVIARDAFEHPEPLKALYLLLLRHIQRKSDIDRSEGGAYSPELRDYAQDARNAIYGMLERSSGEEAYRALVEIARSELSSENRSFILQQARSKAEQAGDLVPWTPEAIREFQETLQRTPCNLKELGETAVLKLQDLKDNLENSDYSIAKLLLRKDVPETEVRNAIGEKLRDLAQGRYSIFQEDEHSDGRRPDLQFGGNGFDGRVPVELKLASEKHWSGPGLLERLENQLCGDYLRDSRSGHGIFLLVNRVHGKTWRIDRNTLDFPGLVEALRSHWNTIRGDFSHIDKVEVIGIDLTVRMNRKTPQTVSWRSPKRH
jgi:hypothetical protein